MKLLLFFVSLVSLSVKAQLFEPLDKWGIRTAYTHTNGSRDFGFVGASLNSIAVDRSGLAAIGAKVYAGTHIGKPDHWQLIPEIGTDAFFILPVGAGVSVNTEAITPRIGISLLGVIELYWGRNQLQRTYLFSNREFVWLLIVKSLKNLRQIYL